MRRQLLVIGCGKLGSALVNELWGAGWGVTAVSRCGTEYPTTICWDVPQIWPPSRRFAATIVAVPDHALPDVVRQLTTQPLQCPVVLHTAGALPATALRGLPPKFAVGAMHPMCAVSGPRDPSPLIGALYAIGGEPEAVEMARRLVADLKGITLDIADEARPSYHAAAALVANDWVALFDAAESLADRAGLDRTAMRAGLLHLAQTALARIAGLDPTRPAIAGLTGAVERGDAATIASHLAALRADKTGRALHVAASKHLVARLVAHNWLEPTQAAALTAALASKPPLPV